MKSRTAHIFQFWAGDRGLTAFLAVLVIMVFIIGPIASLTDIGTLLISLFLSLTLITGVAAVAKRRATTVVATGLATVTLFFRWMAHLVPSPEILLVGSFSVIMCLGLLTGVVLVQAFRAGPITGHRIQGAVAAYLLLGLTWAFAYELVLLQVPGSFQPADLGGAKGPVTINLVYFSFVTLTTVGYGDITPAHPIVRSLANLESLIGQLYPAILIGRLVSMELQFRQSK
jgi:hypothetical protein